MSCVAALNANNQKIASVKRKKLSPGIVNATSAHAHVLVQNHRKRHHGDVRNALTEIQRWDPSPQAFPVWRGYSGGSLTRRVTHSRVLKPDLKNANRADELKCALERELHAIAGSGR